MSKIFEIPNWHTVLKTITMPADIDASGHVPTGWLLAKMDLAGAVLPGQHFRGPVQLIGLSGITISGRPRLGQCITFRCHWISGDTAHALLDIEACSEDRGQIGEEKLLGGQLRYVPAVVEVPEHIFPGSF
jgi:acyl-CoA thioesterase YciA